MGARVGSRAQASTTTRHFEAAVIEGADRAVDSDFAGVAGEQDAVAARRLQLVFSREP